MTSRFHVAVRAFALLAMFSIPSRASASDDYVDASDDLVLRNVSASPATAFAVGTPVVLGASVARRGTHHFCEGDRGMSCSSSTPCGNPKEEPYGVSVEATIESVSCDDPRCVATFDAVASTVTVTMPAPNEVRVTATMRKSDGTTITGTTAVAFDTPTSIEVTRADDTSIGSSDVVVPDQSFTWCATIKGAAGGSMDGITAFASRGGLTGTGSGCATITAATPGEGTVVVTSGALSATYDVRVIDPSTIRAIDWVDVKRLPWDPEDRVEVPKLSTLPSVIDPMVFDAADNCLLLLAARFTTTDGWMGYVPIGSIVTSGSAGPPTSSRSNTLEFNATYIQPTTVTLSATLGPVSSSLNVSLGKCGG